MMKNVLLFIIYFTLLSGCASGYKKYYVHIAPSQYPQTNNIFLFQYENIDLDFLYETVFNEYLLIGKSRFEGPYENPKNIITYAQSIGADFLITNKVYSRTDNSSFIGINYGAPITSYIPVSVDRYIQEAIFLKNISGTIPVWKKQEKDYIKTEDSIFDGIWINKDYELSVYKSNEYIVGFIINVTSKNMKNSKKGDLKFIFDYEESTGLFFMANKKPVPARFSINKFDHLYVELLNLSYLSFQRKE